MEVRFTSFSFLFMGDGCRFHLNLPGRCSSTQKKVCHFWTNDTFFNLRPLEYYIVVLGNPYKPFYLPLLFGGGWIQTQELPHPNRRKPSWPVQFFLGKCKPFEFLCRVPSVDAKKWVTTQSFGSISCTC